LDKGHLLVLIKPHSTAVPPSSKGTGLYLRNLRSKIQSTIL